MGLKPITSCWEPFFGGRSLLPDSVLFTGKVPSEFFTLGPQVWPGMSHPVTVLREKLDDCEPLIYITSGTSQFGRFREVARMLSQVGWQVILSGGVRGAKVREVVREGSLYVCAGLMPGSQIAKQADVILCHGGSQTLYQAACAGTFAFVEAQHFDHERNGAMFATHGMAKMLGHDSSTEDIAGEIVNWLKLGARRSVCLPTDEVRVEGLLSFLAT